MYVTGDLRLGTVFSDGPVGKGMMNKNKHGRGTWTKVMVDSLHNPPITFFVWQCGTVRSEELIVCQGDPV
jgi:hypothetical protein